MMGRTTYGLDTALLVTLGFDQFGHENSSSVPVMTEQSEDITAGSATLKSEGRTIIRQASGVDAAVIEALRRGDEEAFTRLVEQHQHSLLRIARLYVSSSAIADEVVQDTWLAVIRGLWAFEGRSSLKTWILRILINRSKTRALREGRTVPFSDAGVSDDEASDARGRPDDTGFGIASLHDPGHSPEERLLAEEAGVRIRAAIDALPLNQRTVILMRDMEGCSSEEVCNTLGVSETNQRVILHRARSSVRTMLTAPARKR
jgi:RNA polymerase sigma-70 factor (ECF subfamily)